MVTAIKMGENKLFIKNNNDTNNKTVMKPLYFFFSKYRNKNFVDLARTDLVWPGPIYVKYFTDIAEKFYRYI